MQIKDLPAGMAVEIFSETQRQTREWWEQFLRLDGIELLRQMLVEAEAAEKIKINIRVKTSDGTIVPEGVALMLVMRAALKTQALASAAERAVDEHASEHRNSAAVGRMVSVQTGTHRRV